MECRNAHVNRQVESTTGHCVHKARVLKKLATLFDPLQMLASFTIRARMAMQETWLLGLQWDDEFPVELKKKCQEWFCQLPELCGPNVKRSLV